MFIAHLPAGYLLTKSIQHKAGNHISSLLWTGLIASIFPDVDLLYFYLMDHRQTLHHHYITHLPLFWLAFGAIAYFVLRIMNKGYYTIYVSVALACVLLHMFLDSIAAGIYWLYPLVDVEVNFFKVPAPYSWWVWNFVFHWTFLLEILTIVAAGVVWRTQKPIVTKI